VRDHTDVVAPLRIAILVAGLVSLGCGASTPSPVTSPLSTAEPTPAATPTSAPGTPTTGATGGFGDTTVNPDAQYICAAQAVENTEVIAYTTVAGADASGGQGVCSAMVQGSNGAWSVITSISNGSFETAPICWLTAGNDQVTQRVYTARPDGADAVTKALCDDLFTGAGVTPQ
jgi:hypothetical protein